MNLILAILIISIIIYILYKLSFIFTLIGFAVFVLGLIYVFGKLSTQDYNYFSNRQFNFKRRRKIRR